MAIRNAEQYDPKDLYLQRLVRKRDQAWEMAGLARQDNDKADEERRTAEAREYQRLISEYVA